MVRLTSVYKMLLLISLPNSPSAKVTPASVAFCHVNVVVPEKTPGSNIPDLSLNLGFVVKPEFLTSTVGSEAEYPAP